MAKQKISLALCAVLLLLCSCMAPDTSVSSSVVTSSSVSTTGSSEPVVEIRTYEIMKNEHIGFLQEDVTQYIEQPEEPPRTLRKVFLNGDILYYLSSSTAQSNIIKRDLLTGQEQTICQSTSLIDRFLLLDESNLLVIFREKNEEGSLSQEVAYNDYLFHYNVNTGVFTSGQEMYGIQEKYIHKASYANSTILLDMYTPMENTAIYRIVDGTVTQRIEESIAESTYDYWMSFYGSNLLIHDKETVSVINNHYPEAVGLFTMTWMLQHMYELDGEYMYIAAKNDETSVQVQINLKSQQKINETLVPDEGLAADERLESQKTDENGFSMRVMEAEEMGGYSRFVRAQLHFYNWAGEEVRQYPPFMYPASVYFDYVLYNDAMYVANVEPTTQTTSLGILHPVA